MIACKLCGAETAWPCGPIRAEVCPSCWLAIGCDDDIAMMAENINEGREWADDLREQGKIMADFFEMLKECKP